MTDKMRDEFEEAMSVETGRPIQEFRDDRQGDSYVSVGAKYAWWGWKASREALVIDLADVTRTRALPDRTWLLGNDVLKSIEAAGLKVKP